MKILCFALLLPLFLKAEQAPKRTNNTFGPGERLKFEVEYGFLNGGYGTMEVLDTIRYRGRICHQIRAIATSNKGLSLVYPVRDTNISIVDAEGLYSHRILKHINEGKYVRFRTTEFTPDAGIARTVDHTVLKDSTMNTANYMHDIMSAFFYFRTIDIKDSIDLWCVDDFKQYPLRVRIDKRETIKTDLGKFSCIVVEPVMTSSGIFMKKGKINIWLTDDERKLPVKVKFKMPYLGSITCNLIEYNPAKIVKLP
ncbi:MAG: DUF3108 domain-containing protein [Fibrobacteres bacterium]|nr:DUF3108 domain-containing protein [Fibrobacterota bacterium]